MVEVSQHVEGYALARKMIAGGDDEASVGANPVVHSKTLKWGVKEENSYLLEATFERNIHQQESMGQFYPDAQAGDYPAKKVNIKPFRMTNGTPLKAIYGYEYDTVGSSYYVANIIHDIRPIDLDVYTTYTRKQRYTVFEQMGNTTTDIEHEIFGVMFTDLIIAIDRGGKITATMSGLGGKQDIGEDLFTQDPVTPVLPKTLGGTEVTSFFTHVQECKYNDIDFSKWVAIQVQAKQFAEGHIGDDPYYDHIDEQYPVYTAFTVTCLSLPTGLIADAKAAGGQAREFILMINKGNKDTTELAAELVTGVSGDTVDLTSAGSIDQYNGNELHVTLGDNKHERYYIYDTIAGTPAQVKVYPTPPANLDGDTVEILSGDNRYIKWKASNAYIASIDYTKIAHELVLWAVTIIAQNVICIVKDEVRDADYDEPIET